MEDMVVVKDVNFTIGDFSLRDVNLTIKEGEYYVFLGPSGNGKTQLLKIIAGLNKVDSGEVWIGGKRREHLPPEDRDIGFVFQDQVLFPHMSVFDNIAFALKLKRMAKSDIKIKIKELSEILGISYLLERYTKNLSGGEKQRVALARAMISKPNVLIMDEPYAALDRNLAERLTLESKELHDRLRQTTIHVTHNQEEAITLADRVCILENGRVRMIGTPDEIFRKPNSCFVADFVCTENIFENGEVKENGDGLLRIAYMGKELMCDYKDIAKIASNHTDERRFLKGEEINSVNGKVDFCIRPENTILYSTHPGEEENVFEAEIVEIYDRGLMFQIALAISNDFFFTNMTMRRRFLNMNIRKGDSVYLSVDERSIHIIE